MVSPATPVGDVHAHAPPLSEVKNELRLELIAAPVTNATYIDPLQYVTVWERTDQGVDASMPVGAPILAPCTVKVLAIIPDWYAGQPLVYFELLNGPDAGKVQYVAEQITSIAPAGSILQQGQPIARFAPSGTADRVRLVDLERGDAGESDDGLRGGSGHAGGAVDSRLAEQPGRQRRQRLTGRAPR